MASPFICGEPTQGTDSWSHRGWPYWISICKDDVEGFKMNLIYYDRYQATRLEKFVTAYGQFLKSNGEQPVTWKRAATIEDVLREADVVLYDRDTGRSRGFAFVIMSSVENCEAVIQNLDGSYDGRTMRVNFSDKLKPRVPLYPETEYKLFIGNLSWSVTSESLTEVFQEYGNVVGARVLYYGDIGQSRGYGFVCYSTKQEMDDTLESLNGVVYRSSFLLERHTPTSTTKPLIVLHAYIQCLVQKFNPKPYLLEYHSTHEQELDGRSM